MFLVRSDPNSYLVSLVPPDQSQNFLEIVLTMTLEHARLKEHVASMNGGLEARIHEGGKDIIGLLFTEPEIFFLCRHTQPSCADAVFTMQVQILVADRGNWFRWLGHFLRPLTSSFSTKPPPLST